MNETIRQHIREQVAALPHAPGVYQFVDSKGVVIYVGKAKSLKKRVSSYFVESRDHSAKVVVLVRQIVDIRHIVVDSEQDALLLENSLIKSLQPRYNILLKDDKTYPWITIRREPFPRVQSTRQLIRDIEARGYSNIRTKLIGAMQRGDLSGWGPNAPSIKNKEE